MYKKAISIYRQRFSAPSIYENEDIKKGILLQLFGGAKKDFGETGRGHFRYEAERSGIFLLALPCNDNCTFGGACKSINRDL